LTTMNQNFAFLFFLFQYLFNYFYFPIINHYLNSMIALFILFHQYTKNICKMLYL